MEATFRTFCGEAGSLDIMLIAENSEGQKERTFISRVGWFQHFFMKRAKKTLLKKLELRTGQLHIEKVS